MIMDRQLDRGGWNYGNITIFGKELFPIPDSTAIARFAGVGSPIARVAVVLATTLLMVALGVGEILPVGFRGDDGEGYEL